MRMVVPRVHCARPALWLYPGLPTNERHMRMKRSSRRWSASGEWQLREPYWKGGGVTDRTLKCLAASTLGQLLSLHAPSFIWSEMMVIVRSVSVLLEEFSLCKVFIVPATRILDIILPVHGRDSRGWPHRTSSRRSWELSEAVCWLSDFHTHKLPPSSLRHVTTSILFESP